MSGGGGGVVECTGPVDCIWCHGTPATLLAGLRYTWFKPDLRVDGTVRSRDVRLAMCVRCCGGGASDHGIQLFAVKNLLSFSGTPLLMRW